jgi:hypothetical protein
MRVDEGGQQVLALATHRLEMSILAHRARGRYLCDHAIADHHVMAFIQIKTRVEDANLAYQ